MSFSFVFPPLIMNSPVTTCKSSGPSQMKTLRRYGSTYDLALRVKPRRPGRQLILQASASPNRPSRKKFVKMKKEMLISQMEKFNLDTSGNKRELIDRMCTHIAAKTVPPILPPEEEEVDWTADTLMMMNKVDLKMECSRRHLYVSGTKQQIVDRLMQYRENRRRKGIQDTLKEMQGLVVETGSIMKDKTERLIEIIGKATGDDAEIEESAAVEEEPWMQAGKIVEEMGRTRIAKMKKSELLDYCLPFFPGKDLGLLTKRQIVSIIHGISEGIPPSPELLKQAEVDEDEDQPIAPTEAESIRNIASVESSSTFGEQPVERTEVSEIATTAEDEPVPLMDAVEVTRPIEEIIKEQILEDDEEDQDLARFILMDQVKSRPATFVGDIEPVIDSILREMRRVYGRYIPVELGDPADPIEPDELGDYQQGLTTQDELMRSPEDFMDPSELLLDPEVFTPPENLLQIPEDDDELLTLAESSENEETVEPEIADIEEEKKAAVEKSLEKDASDEEQLDGSSSWSPSLVNGPDLDEFNAIVDDKPQVDDSTTEAAATQPESLNDNDTIVKGRRMSRRDLPAEKDEDDIEEIITTLRKENDPNFKIYRRSETDSYVEDSTTNDESTDYDIISSDSQFEEDADEVEKHTLWEDVTVRGYQPLPKNDEATDAIDKKKEKADPIEGEEVDVDAGESWKKQEIAREILTRYARGELLAMSDERFLDVVQPLGADIGPFREAFIDKLSLLVDFDSAEDMETDLIELSLSQMDEMSPEARVRERLATIVDSAQIPEVVIPEEEETELIDTSSMITSPENAEQAEIQVPESSPLENVHDNDNSLTDLKEDFAYQNDNTAEDVSKVESIQEETSVEDTDAENTVHVVDEVEDDLDEIDEGVVDGLPTTEERESLTTVAQLEANSYELEFESIASEASADVVDVETDMTVAEAEAKAINLEFTKPSEKTEAAAVEELESHELVPDPDPVVEDLESTSALPDTEAIIEEADSDTVESETKPTAEELESVAPVAETEADMALTEMEALPFLNTINDATLTEGTSDAETALKKIERILKELKRQRIEFTANTSDFHEAADVVTQLQENEAKKAALNREIDALDAKYTELSQNIKSRDTDIVELRQDINRVLAEYDLLPFAPIVGDGNGEYGVFTTFNPYPTTFSPTTIRFTFDETTREYTVNDTHSFSPSDPAVLDQYNYNLTSAAESEVLLRSRREPTKEMTEKREDPFKKPSAIAAGVVLGVLEFFKNMSGSRSKKD